MTNVFISALSFSLTNASAFDDIDRSFEDLQEFIELSPKYNNIEVVKDLLEYKVDAENNLEDILYVISNYSDPEHTAYLNELDKIISTSKSNLYTDEVITYATAGQVFRGDFVSYYDQNNVWPGIPSNFKVCNEDELFQLNYGNLGNHPIDAVSFSDRSQLMFNNIDL